MVWNVALRHALEEVEEGSRSFVAEAGVLHWVSHGESVARNRGSQQTRREERRLGFPRRLLRDVVRLWLCERPDAADAIALDVAGQGIAGEVVERGCPCR